MIWKPDPAVTDNSFGYFERTLIRGTGFREYDVRWLFPRDINPNGFLVLGRAYGSYVRRKFSEQTVVVGHDFRAYSQELCRSFIIGLLSTGARVLDVGLCLTPMVYFAQHRFQTRAAAMITASHNENGWTGIKFAGGLSRTLGPEDIRELQTMIENGSFLSGAGRYEAVEDLFQAYLRDLVGERPLSRPMKVVIAAGNGTAGRFAPAALRALGCETVEVDCNADWRFPHHNPNPEDVAFLEGIRSAALSSHAELGLGIDGDGDRLGVIDDRGREIFSDKLGLILARFLCQKEPGRKIAIDVKSTGLFFDDPVLKSTGTEVVMVKTGHSYLKAAIAEHDALAGFEKSGHWFFGRPLGRGYDDGLLSMTHVLRLLDSSGARLSELADALPATWQSPTLSPFCPDDVKYAVVDQVAASYRQDEAKGASIGGHAIREIVSINGVRFVLDDQSWGLVRASSNKPSLVVVAEARSSRRQLYDIVADIQSRLAATGQVGEYDQQLPELEATSP